MKNSITILIETKYGDLRTSEKQAADYILAHMDKIRELSLEKLSGKIGVSQPTVVRLSKALGFKGYKEFRYAVVEELARDSREKEGQQPMYGYSLSRKDKLEDIPGKVVATTERIMEETLKNIPISEFKKVIQALKTARVIEDVAVGISFSGYSKDTVEVMKEARKSGAVTIVITSFRDSLISRYADILICTSRKQLFYGDAIFSRTSQLMVVDMIYMGLIASDYDRFVKQLDRSSRIIRDKAYSPV